jgi:hypothetical protein
MRRTLAEPTGHLLDALTENEPREEVSTPAVSLRRSASAGMCAGQYVNESAAWANGPTAVGSPQLRRSPHEWADEIARRHWTKLVRHARRPLGPYFMEAEDITQNALHMLLDGRLTPRETEHEVRRTTMAAVGNLARHVIRRQSCTADLTEVPGRRQSSTDWDRAARALLTKSVPRASPKRYFGSPMVSGLY